MPDDPSRHPESPPESVAAPARARRRGLVSVLFFLIPGALAIGGYVWWTHQSATPAPGLLAGKGAGLSGPGASRALPVIAEPVRRGTIDVYLDALGTVTPRNLVTVKPRVDGQLMKLHFEEGQLVKAGELLAEIDPRPFAVQLAQAQGQLAKDAAQLANARVDLERYRTLLGEDSIARQQVDTQEALVRQYEGTVQADQGAVDSARLQLSYARVTAPIGGRVGLRQVDPGNIVHASDANGIVVIAQLAPIGVIFPVPEDNLPLVMRRLTHHEPTVVEAWNREGKTKLATGKLVTADNQIDTTTGTVKMKAEFANTDGVLFPNQFVNVRMNTQTLTDATLVPSAAIQRGAPGTFVYAINDDQTVHVVPVKLGPVQGNVTVIASGIRPGAMLVVDGADKLREGAKVDVVTREGQAVAPPKQGSRGQRDAGIPGGRATGAPREGVRGAQPGAGAARTPATR